MNDRILDAFIEEALGAAQPPDLTERVIAALAKRRSEAESERIGGVSEGVDLSPRPVTLPITLPVPVVLAARQPSQAIASRALPVGGRRAKPTRRTALAAVLAVAAALLLAVGGYWLSGGEATRRVGVAKNSADQPTAAPNPTDRHATVTEAAVTEAAVKKTAGDSAVPGRESQAGGPEPMERVAAASPPNVEGAPAANSSGVGSSSKDSRRFASDAANPSTATELDSASAGGAVADASLDSISLDSALSPSASTDAEVIAYVNSALKARWKESGVRPSPPATESEWCRRAYLDCIGRIPTVEELEAFLVDNRRDKRARLIDTLLDGERYVESYARFWTTLWTNRLIGRKGGMEANSLIHRQGLQQYLRRSFLANKPYQRLAYELVCAQGSNRPGESDYNGAVNFLLAHLPEKATPATAKTAQVFLGLQVQCTQCHNHPFNEWKQNRFWELNAFFRQMHSERTMAGNQIQSVRLLDGDFAGEGSVAAGEGSVAAGEGSVAAGEERDAQEAEVYFELRNGVLQVAYPTFIDGTPIDRSGLVSVVNRRRELALAISRSAELKLAIVNWMWSHFFGYGFTKPVDDMGAHNPPSHPELLARLSDELAGHGYDLKRLIRWIVLSEAYALSSKFGPKLGNAVDDPTLGGTALFSHFYVRQMSAEQLYDSLLVATGAHLAQVNYEQQQLAKDRWLEQFAIAFSTDENDEATTFDGTIAQTLVMMNGELTRQATSGESGNFLSRVSLRSERAAALNELYLAALARRPSRQEVRLANSLLTEQSGNAETALQDIWWALLNSNEFILNH